MHNYHHHHTDRESSLLKMIHDGHGFHGRRMPSLENPDPSFEDAMKSEAEDERITFAKRCGLYIGTNTILMGLGLWFGIEFWICSLILLVLLVLLVLLFLFNPKDGKRFNVMNLLHSMDGALSFSLLLWAAIWCGEKLLGGN